MNGHERIQVALSGKWPDQVPVMLHGFRMAAAEAGVSMAEYRRDPQAIARCLIAAVEKYQYDGIVVDVDTATLAGTLGVPIDFPDDEPARCRAAKIESLAAVANLEPVEVGKYAGVQVWLEAVRLLKRHFDDEVYIRGHCDQCAFSLASAMRGPQHWLWDIARPKNEPLAHKLLAYCNQATQQFVKLMAEAGADMVSNGDTAAGPATISPRMYRQFAWPYEKQVATLAKKLGLPYALHICGDTGLILDDMIDTGANCLELDYKTDVKLVHKALLNRAVMIGNIDPVGVLASGSVATVGEKTRELLDQFVDTGQFILSAGCAIPPGTPSENLHAMIRTARQFGQS